MAKHWLVNPEPHWFSHGINTKITTSIKCIIKLLKWKRKKRILKAASRKNMNDDLSSGTTETGMTLKVLE